MNILFLTIARVMDISERGIYTDLLRKFKKEGHNVYVASPAERRYQEATRLVNIDGVNILNIRTLNIQKTNIVEKGIGTLLLEPQFLAAIKKYFNKVKFDLVIYTTPPITFTSVIKYVKQRDSACTYLLLKDIFPQNAVDLGMIKEGGAIHRFFRAKEKKLYEVSDYIGCMSPANVDFVLRHNSQVAASKVEVNPNSIEPLLLNMPTNEKLYIREKYGIAPDQVLFIYGGNLGKPQGIDFLIEVLKSNINKEDRFFLIVGDGTEFNKLKLWMNANTPQNACLLKNLPKAEYDELLASCDVGMIFLDKKFTIPNFPSRLLSYLECKLPVIAATDANTDIGKIIEEYGFGRWCLSGDLNAYSKHLTEFCNNANERSQMGFKAYHYLNNNCLVQHSYQIIMQHFKNV